MKKSFVLSVLILFFGVLAVSLQINISHLENVLAQQFYLKGEQVKGYWVYAERKDGKYFPQTALSEGDFCVDDVARVVLLYSEAYEITKDVNYLRLALDAAKFVLKMQAEDGEFYNFAWVDGMINQHGITSKKSTSWWALRAFWALGKLYNVSKDTVVLEALQKAYRAISKTPPIYRDQMALYLLGLCEYNKISDVSSTIESIAAQLVLSLKRDGPFQGFFSWNPERFAWNGWGNRYAEALLEAYRETGNENFLNTALESLKRQITLLLGTGFLYSIDKSVKPYPELSYAVEPLVVAACKAYQITLKDEFAYLCASTVGWYFGLNRLGQMMVGPNGEGYDGMEYMHINRNAGAESTICAQRSILYLSTLPQYYQLLARNSRVIGSDGLIILEAEGADPGISYVSTLVGDFGAGAALAFSGKARLRWSSVDLRVPGSVAISGNFKNTKVMITAANSVSAEIFGEGIFELGKIEPATTVRITLDGEGVIDQLIFIPQSFGICVDFEGTPLSLSYSEDEKLKIQRQALFVREESPIKEQITAKYEKDGNYLLLNLEQLFNNDGIGTRENRANFDNLGGVLGSYYPAELFEEGVISVGQVPFRIKLVGKDNVRTNLQKIVFEEPLKVKKIHILCAANHGDYETIFLVNNEPLRFFVKDWCIGEKSIQFEYRYLASGEKQFIKCGIDHIILEVNEMIQSIVLPDAINVHIFAITLESDK